MKLFDEAIAEIDRLHAEDPAGLELGYAQHMTRWLEQLEPNPDPLLAIAVRAQHLKRWECPRAEYPTGRKGYLQWRRAAVEHHAQLVSNVLSGAGFGASEIDRVATLVLKRGLGSDKDVQALEDCACLVFLETQLSDFVEQHAKPKVERVLRKTQAKMSPRAEALSHELLALRHVD